MIQVTLTIAAIASVIAWVGTPMQALCVYLACLLWYPDFLSAPLGTLDFTLGRILILVCAAKMVIEPSKLDVFKPRRFDLLILLVFAAKIFALASSESLSRSLEAASGNFCNTVLPYFVVRAAVRTRAHLTLFMQAMCVFAIPLAVLGCIQCITGYNPFKFMQGYISWTEAPLNDAVRWGLFRATVTFDQYIAFGLFFASVLPLALTGADFGTHKWWKVLVVIALLAGTLSSMSTAPLFSLAISIAFLAFYPFRKYAVVLIAFMIATAIFLEFASDRHFYEVLSRVAMDPSTAYDRVGLYKEAFGGGMRGHWLFGFGFVGLGAGNTNTYFSWEFKDFTSFYIEHLVKFGLIVVIPLLLMNVGYYVALNRTFKSLHDERDRWTLWCIASTLIGWNVAMLTVTTVSILPQLLFMYIGIAVSLDTVFATEPEHSGALAGPQRPQSRAPVLAGGRN